MSAPETNIETQKRRHRGPLIGMIAVVIFALGLIVWWLLEQSAESDPPQGSTTQIDGRTGDVAGEPAASAPAGSAPAENAPSGSAPTPPVADPAEVPAAPQTVPAAPAAPGGVPQGG